MKVLVVYASSGAGHFKAAEAICDYIHKHCPQIQLSSVDVLEKTNFLFKFNYRFGYSFLIRQAPLLWRWAFWLTDFRAFRIFTRAIGRFLNRLNTNEFIRFLVQEGPDVIISTHFLPSEISSGLKKAKKIKSRLITVITDFCVHPFWVSSGTDIYIVASKGTKEELIREGAGEDIIKELGIPIHSKFLKQYEKDALLRKLGLGQDKFTVLIVTGSFGLGPLEEIADLLYKEARLLVVCANNRRLYERLKNKNYPQVYIFGFVDNIEELMSVSDVVITKPGGLAISEILSMELIPIFISAIPGQEAGNVEILKKYGIGISPESISEIKQTVLDFRDHPSKLNDMKLNIRKIRKPDCLKEICNVVCQGCAGDPC